MDSMVQEISSGQFWQSCTVSWRNAREATISAKQSKSIAVY